MHFAVSFALLASLISFSAAQDLASLPTCMTNCMFSAPTGDCGTTDIACLCGNEEFLRESTACVIESCSGDDIQKALDGSAALCESAGQPVPDSALQSASAMASSKLAGETATGTATSPASSETAESASQDGDDNNNGAAVLGTGVSLVGLVAGAVLAL